ncbi:MAG: hypothetical protein J2P41_15190 [Blastocatellia bacterium]|nr:hypothetical protein [Blastocatellia bacterium]
MTAKEWRNHTDERIAGMFAAQDENARQIGEFARQISELTRKQDENAKQLAEITSKQDENAKQLAEITKKQEENSKQIADLTRTVSEMFIETNRRINENWDKTQETIKVLLATQANAELRTDKLREDINRVINKVDSWLESLQSHNGKQ